ncbi:MAG: hypothetical protein WAX69_18260 [Victivallales bacterium]
MKLQPTTWSIVLVGWWNPAILSPAGISKHIFKLPQDEKIQVAIPLDGISAYIVSNPNETLDVHVEKERLQIDIKKCNYDSLAEGMQAALNALEVLPITPIKAIGYNLIFTAPSSCAELIAVTECPLDTQISDMGLKIIGRSFSRSITFGDGQVNFSVSGQPEKFHVNCNFHLGTQDQEKAKTWLRTPVAVIREKVRNIGSILKVQLEETQNDGSNAPKPIA